MTIGNDYITAYTGLIIYSVGAIAAQQFFNITSIMQCIEVAGPAQSFASNSFTGITQSSVVASTPVNIFADFSFNPNLEAMVKPISNGEILSDSSFTKYESSYTVPTEIGCF